MKNWISTFFSLLITLALNAQVNDSEAYFSGSYDKKFIRKNKIKQINVEVSLNRKKSSCRLLNFDETGLLRKQTILDSNNKKVNDYFFEYNKQGDQIERKNISHNLKKTYIVTFGKTYTGILLIKETSSDLPFITEHIYNSQGQKIESVIFLSDDISHAAKRILNHTYDEKGRLISVKEGFSKENASEPQIIGTTEYIYDNDNNVVIITRTNAATYYFSYNKNGLLKSKKTKMPEDLSGMEIIEKYSYEFWK